MTVGERIRDERRRRMWSQEYLARRAGLHATEVSRLERDLRQPRLRTVLSVAGALGLTAGQLLDDVDVPEAVA